MEKGPNRRIFYGISIITIFLLTLFSAIYYNPLHDIMDSLHLTPFLIVISFIVGAATYAYMSEKVEHKQQSLKKTTEIILRFLNEDERKVIHALFDSNGKVLQAQITRLPGMTKLRAHRTVKRLISRNILEVEKYGKTNSLQLTKEIKEALSF